MAPMVVVLLVVFSFQARWMFRRELTFQPDRVRELMQLDEREALLPGSLLLKALVVLGVVTLAFVLQGPLGYDPSVVALLGAGVLLLIARGDRVEYLRDIEWPTLVFFIGLFIMVGGLVKTGVIEELADKLVELTDGRLFLATAILLSRIRCPVGAGGQHPICRDDGADRRDARRHDPRRHCGAVVGPGPRSGSGW